MTRAWKVALLLAVILIPAMSVSLAWSTPQKTPVFSPKDREIIGDYYKRIAGTLAPGSIDRSSFPVEIEESLKIGSHLGMQLKNQLERLPDKLESQLSSISADYGRYRLGRHVVLVNRGDMTIADILKNVAVK